MVLEAVVLVVDNSEWMRNGDFSPSRYDAQFDTCQIICGQRSEDNAQSSLALITSAGDRPEVKVTLTDDIGEIITSLHKVRIQGKSNFVQSLKVGQLVLNHKRNPLQRLRIIVFIGSPIRDSENDLIAIAESLRKNSISVDIVSFGETEANDSKLELFFKTLTQGMTQENIISNLIKVPVGIGGSLSDHLRQTPILSVGRVGEDIGGGGVNPSIDPELYQVLELSRQQYENENKPQDSNQENIPPLDPDGDVNMYDDDMNQAILLSLQTGQGGEAPKTNPNTETTNPPETHTPAQDNTKPNLPVPDDMNVDLSNISSDDLKDVMKDLDGVDMSDPEIQKLFLNLQQNMDEKKPEEKKE